MYKVKYLFLVCIGYLLCTITNAQIIFQKSYGGKNEDVGYYVKQTSDGGFIITGSTTSFGDGDHDIYLIKTNSQGELQWTKTYEDSSSQIGYCVQQTFDGGYIISGQGVGINGGSYDVYLIKTDANGNLIWNKAYGGIYSDGGFYVLQCIDGGYIVTGETSSFGLNYTTYDIYVIRTDAFGDTLWTRTYGGLASDNVFSIEPTTDGGYILGAETNSFPGAGLLDFYLIKIDDSGNVLWSKNMGSEAQDIFHSAKQTSDGGFIMTGRIYMFGAGGWNLYLIKTDSTGNLIWSKSLDGGGLEEGKSVQECYDGSFLIAGYSINSGTSDFLLLKVNSAGTLIWSKVVGGFSSSLNGEEPYAINGTSDFGNVVVGHTQTWGIGLSDVYLIKMDSSGNAGCNEAIKTLIETTPATLAFDPPTVVSFPNTVVTTPSIIVGSGGTETPICIITEVPEIEDVINQISVYPNPSTETISLTSQQEFTSLRIINILGEEVLHQTFLPKKEMEINISPLPAGIYFLRAETKGMVQVKKFIKE